LSPKPKNDRTGRGVTADDACEYGPVPIRLTAATLKTYGVLFVSPVTAADEAALCESENVVHEDPLLLEY
jgi:hypothetical protein